MSSEREFSQFTFPRKLDVKRLKAALSTTMRDLMKTSSPGAAPVRPERILIETHKTTVFLSGNRPGLDAVGVAIRRHFSDVYILNASREDLVRPPQLSGSQTAGNRESPRRK